MNVNKNIQISVLAVFLCLAQNLLAINIVIDYTYDTTNFFGSGNPAGAVAGVQAKATIEKVANELTILLDNQFSTIVTPDPFHSQSFNGQVTWNWNATFNNPSGSGQIVLPNPTTPADEYRIFVGSEPLGSTLGRGGPGGFQLSSNPSGGFTSDEIDQINFIHEAFSDAVTTRGQETGFVRWGGAMTFNPSPSKAWNFDYTTLPGNNNNDFYSVAIHEMTHAIGFGGSDQWNDLVIASTTFQGANAMAEFGGSPVPVSGDDSHWFENTQSTILGTAIAQEAAMDPNLTVGTRKVLTDLDAAGLKDIGWLLNLVLKGDVNNDGVINGFDVDPFVDVLLNGPFNAAADMNNDGAVNGFDVDPFVAAVLGNAPVTIDVPEPATFALLAMVGVFIKARR